MDTIPAIPETSDEDDDEDAKAGRGKAIKLTESQQDLCQEV